MAAVMTRDIYVGNRNLNPPDWIPFEWTDPLHGPQLKGEVIVICPEGTSGNLSAGLWRTGYEIPGCEADGSCRINYSAPLGDETMVILEGSAEVTETATGRKHEIAAGTILSHPKGVDLYWEISRPFLKKFWVMWDSPKSATKEDHLYVANVSDNPSTWKPFKWIEPEHGRQTCGEVHTIRRTGSTGSYMCGLWRTGVGIAGCAPNGTATFPYSAPLGDETLLLLEGQANVVNEDTGEEYNLSAGDMVGLPSGLPVTWTSTTPFLKTFKVITRDALPASLDE